jgi:hypothetical protein
MRYWVNFLRTVTINDIETIKELETFIRYPNGIYKKRNDKFFDDRVMAMVWALFILEPEICQQWFQIDEYDSQNKPLKIVSNGYFESSEQSYIIKDLNNNVPVFVEELPEEKTLYTPLITEEDYERLYDNSDLDDLIGAGWTSLS